jgi:hypothetical protein
MIAPKRLRQRPGRMLKVYRSAFIAGLHDVRMIFERSRQQKGACR